MRKRKGKIWLLCIVLGISALVFGKDIWQSILAEAEKESITYEESLSPEASGKAAKDTGIAAETEADSSLVSVPVREFEDEFDKARYEIGLDAAQYAVLAEAQKGQYAFETLSQSEKHWYLDIYAVLSHMTAEIELYKEENTALGIADIDKLFNCVLNDHPELFYVDGYTYTHYTHGEDTVRITFSGSYTMDKEEAAIRKEQIDLYVEECLSGISPEASGYEKVKYIYDYIITHTEYNLQAAENQNICSVFIGRESVCQGYAKATQYLLNKLQVKTTLVIGIVDNGQGHAWNLVQINGQYYYVDTTWGDASYQEAEEQAEVEDRDSPTINYDYLCVTTRQLGRTHVIQNVVPMPECVSMDANYYIMENAYFTAFDETQLAALFADAYARERSDVTLKCADEAVYAGFLEELIDNQKIFRYLNSADGVIAYADNARQLSLTFWLSAE